MKSKVNTKHAFIALLVVSIYCAFYLQYQTNVPTSVSADIQFVESSMKEGTYLPDVKIVKEILKNIFNIVKA